MFKWLVDPVVNALMKFNKKRNKDQDLIDQVDIEEMFSYVKKTPDRLGMILLLTDVIETTDINHAVSSLYTMIEILTEEEGKNGSTNQDEI